MNEQDKATSTIAQSPSQEFIAKVDKRDKLMRAAGIVVLFFLVVFNVFLALRVQTVLNQIDVNQKENVVRSNTRANVLRAYLTCVLPIAIDKRSEAVVTDCGKQADQAYPLP